MITFTNKGDFSKTNSFLQKTLRVFNLSLLDKYGKRGVEALKAATPVDTGKTAESWYYEIRNIQNGVSICWGNSNENDGVIIAVLLQYGHGLQNGGFVSGTDYINPAMRSVFEELANEAWEELTR